MSKLDYYGRNGCCLTCRDRICNHGLWCAACLCKDCRWYEHIPEVGRGCCFYPGRAKNPQFDSILKELGLIPISKRVKSLDGILRALQKERKITRSNNP